MIVKVASFYSKDERYDILNTIPAPFLNQEVKRHLVEQLDDKVVFIVIEYPYVDKDYRSTYYGFYSKRHKKYGKFCIRLHFFSQIMNNEEAFSDAEESYLGSIVLRPTEVATLGRTLLAPEALKDFSGFVCEAEYMNSLDGIPLKVKTFPHIMQDTDVTICAHAVCWMIARYYSEKYTLYPERLSYDIATSLTDISGGRIIPSKGLTLGQVSEILSSIGFYPEIFVRDLYSDHAFFYELLYAYVESGIPLVAAMHGKQHALAIVGHGDLYSAVDVCRRSQNKIVNSLCCNNSLIANDDNKLPFSKIFFEKKPCSAGEYLLTDIDGFVVPLYEKMYLNAENVMRLLPGLINSNLVSMQTHDKLVLRVFMTSARSFKQKQRKAVLIDPLMKRTQLELPLPKFVWIAEMTTPELYDSRQVLYRWILDATANPYEMYPFLLIHDFQEIVINERTQRNELYRLNLQNPIQPFEMFENNLRRHQ
ncbi:papain-like cysteine protease family protein [Desulfonatronospira sp.]|uniref:papain-like cysteine protease family protein n=1 Tax=Desulfonatronospira sp. TaxID=1962951 RepID=UPI0025C0EFDD|nr:papain-like cysteine protease family protein [Desulfonatronospira sp.]